MKGLQYPAQVRITEVGPRDGLQNEPKRLPTIEKIRLVERLAAAGAKDIEITSFVHPRWVPNLADAEEVVRETSFLSFRSWALVPNRRGLDRAMTTAIHGVTLVMSVTDEHNQANLNRPSRHSLLELLELQHQIQLVGKLCRISLSVAFGCPFAGRVNPQRVAEIVGQFSAAGITRITLCDTIGVATPDQVYATCFALTRGHPQTAFELHLHDTRGMALANTLAGLQAGISSFDASIGGLGGCPYAPGATGNSATEDLNALLQGMNVRTGLDQDHLLAAAAMVAAWRDRPLDSAAWRARSSSPQGDPAR